MGADDLKRLWVDGTCPAPSGWIWAKSYRSALRLLEKHDWGFHSVSLGHDLGGNKTGYDLICFFEERFYAGGIIPLIGVHTNDVAARSRMLDLASGLNGAMIKG
jgi:hypothetical protein